MWFSIVLRLCEERLFTILIQKIVINLSSLIRATISNTLLHMTYRKWEIGVKIIMVGNN